MWVGRVASLPLPPPPTSATPSSSSSSITTTTTTCPSILLPAIFSTHLTLPPRKPADKSITASACARSKPTSSSCFYIHSARGNGGPLDPVYRFFSGGRWRGGFLLAVGSSRGRRGKPASPEFVEMDEGDEDYDEWEDEDGEEEGDGPAMPFDEMRRWMQNKPAGFGEGKSYDTTIEDRLLEEMERSKQGQLANINNLKNGVAGQAEPKKRHPRTTDVDEAEVAPNVARVRVRGLPRKRNIHKDLKLAFKRFPSIVNISPAVVGNKKTRDPVCKGFAFVDFDSDESANKFVQTYSKRSVFFGRVQKEITCDIVSTFHSCIPGLEKSSQYPMFTQEQLTEFQGEVTTDPSMHVSTQDLEEKDERITTEEQPSSLVLDTTMDIEYSHESFLLDEESLGIRNGEETAELVSSKQQQKAQMVSRKKSVKRKSDKPPKLSMPGSVARLKVKERAVLTGVLSKYGERAVPAFSEKS